MYEFECKDIIVPGCKFETSGATSDDVAKAALAHAQSEHKDKVAKMKPAELDGLKKKVMSKIHMV